MYAWIIANSFTKTEVVTLYVWVEREEGREGGREGGIYSYKIKKMVEI